MFQRLQLKWCFILIGILAFGTFIMRLGEFKIVQTWQYVGHLVSLSAYISVCWIIHAYFTQDRFLHLGGKIIFLLSILVGTLASLVLFYVYMDCVPSMFVLPDNNVPVDGAYFNFFRRLISAFFVSLISYIVYNNVYTGNKLQQTQLENEQLKQAHLRAQLLSLQQQISPHFLFNSLSTLKTIAQDRDTKEFVVELSHVYRYLLNFNENQVTRLSEELSFTNSYLYILRQRFENALCVSINIKEEYYANYVIPPLSIQLLIENAIKHNAASAQRPLSIAVYMKTNDELVVENNYQPKKVPVESTGLGLHNINDRYRLLFNKDIHIDASDTYFKVTLPLLRHEHYHN